VVALWRELPVNGQYIFFLNVVNGGYGGIEYRNSTSLLCEKHNLPNKEAANTQGKSSDYIELLRLCAHEYFHLWHVKRIKPACFIQPNLQQEVYTEQLWIFEGITAYFEQIALVRRDIISQAEYLSGLSTELNGLLHTNGIATQTLAESSFYAWSKFYKPDENAMNALVSYYKKGALVALCLDLMLIRDTQGKVSLIDVMRHLWNHYGKVNVGLQEQEFGSVLQQVSGLDYSEFLAIALYTTNSLPILTLLAEFGIKYTTSTPDLITSFGLKLQKNSLKIAAVGNNTAAEASGIAPFDEIIAVNNTKVVANNFAAEMACLSKALPFTLHAFRQEELMVFSATLPEPAATLYTLHVANDPANSSNDQNSTSNQQALRTMWLGQHATS
jgi:predicted metalloprotease with PDZ domain